MIEYPHFLLKLGVFLIRLHYRYVEIPKHRKQKYNLGQVISPAQSKIARLIKHEWEKR